MIYAVDAASLSKPASWEMYVKYNNCCAMCPLQFIILKTGRCMEEVP
jgi:hypothetical protein